MGDDREDLERRLAESEARLRAVSALTSSLICEFDARTGVAIWIGESSCLFGHDPFADPATVDSWLDLIHPDDRPDLLRVVQDCARTGEAADFTYRVVLASGDVRWWQTRATGMHLEGGRPVVWLCAVSDVTEQVCAEVDARHAREALTHVQRVATAGELTATLAHELNQPLAGILSNAQAALRFLDSPAPDLDEVRAALQDVVEDEKRATAVLQRVRSFLRKDAEPAVAVDVNAALSEVLTLLRGQTTGGRVDLDLRLHPRLPSIQGDRVELQQVLMNLLLNALEAQEEEQTSRLLVETYAEGDEIVVITITDSGRGVSADVESKMFDPFFTTKPDGLGMGLSISRSIVGKHKGRLWCEQVEGGGARLVVELPVDGTSFSE